MCVCYVRHLDHFLLKIQDDGLESEMCRNYIKFFAIYSDIPNLVTKVKWRTAAIANAIISCAQSYRQDIECLCLLLYCNLEISNSTLNIS
jgi:hypothetical protein